MRKNRQPPVTWARYVFDSRDATRDRFLRLDDALRLYKEGKLRELTGMDTLSRTFEASDEKYMPEIRALFTGPLTILAKQ